MFNPPSRLWAGLHIHGQSFVGFIGSPGRNKRIARHSSTYTLCYSRRPSYRLSSMYFIDRRAVKTGGTGQRGRWVGGRLLCVMEFYGPVVELSTGHRRMIEFTAKANRNKKPTAFWAGRRRLVPIPPLAFLFEWDATRRNRPVGSRRPPLLGRYDTTSFLATPSKPHPQLGKTTPGAPSSC